MASAKHAKNGIPLVSKPAEGTGFIGEETPLAGHSGVLFVEPAAPEEVKKPEDGNFVRGVKKALYQIPETVGGTIGLVGDAVGADGVREYGMGIYDQNHKKVEALTRDSDSLSNVLEGKGNVGDFLAAGTGYVAGQAATALATGGVGGFIGSQLAKRGIREVVARGAESAIAKGVAGKVAATGAKVGAGVALGASNFIQEAGSIYPEAIEQAGKDGRLQPDGTLAGGDLARVVGSAGAAAAVDTAADALMFKGVAGGGRRVIQNDAGELVNEGILQAGKREIPKAMAREAGTEGIQTVIERFGAQQNLTTADAIRDYVDSMGLGALGGGLGGAAASVSRQAIPTLDPNNGPLSRAANETPALTYNPDPIIVFPDGSAGRRAEFDAYIASLPEEKRLTERARLLGLGPQETSPQEKQDQAYAAEHSASQENIRRFSERRHAEPLEEVYKKLQTPGAKAAKLAIVPHAYQDGFTLLPTAMLSIEDQVAADDYAKQAAEAIKARDAEQKQAGKNAEAAAPDAAQEAGAARVQAEQNYLDKERARRDSETTAADGRALSADRKAALEKRFAILDAVLADDTVQGSANKQAKYLAELRRAGYAKQEIRPEEQRHIERHDAIASAFAHDAEPSAPNEMDVAALIPEKKSVQLSTNNGQAPRVDKLPANLVDAATKAKTPKEFYDAAKAAGHQVTDPAVRAPLMEAFKAFKRNKTAAGMSQPDALAIEQAANEAATSKANDLPQPTQAQKDAGNYKKGHVTLHGLDISIENPAGSERSGVSKSGKPWKNKLKHHYGYIKGTVGADKDHIDTFLGPNPKSDKVFVVDQVHPETGKFDEHKVMLGFDSQEEADAAYHANYEKGWKGAKHITETSVGEFKAWLKDGDTKQEFKPAPLDRIRGNPAEAVNTNTDLDGSADYYGTADNPLRFVSGMSAPKDYAALFDANQNVGISMLELSKPSIPKLAKAMADSDGHLFVDSGAFSIFMANVRAKEAYAKDPIKFGNVPPVDRALDFDELIARYEEIARAIGHADDRGWTNDRIFFGMPDIVGDQAGSLALVKKYADFINGAGTSRRIVPLQGGKLTLTQAYEHMMRNLGLDPASDISPIIGIPSQAEAVANDEVQALLEAHGDKISGVHILGAASESRLTPRLDAIKAAGYDGPVSADANSLRSLLYKMARGDAMELVRQGGSEKSFDARRTDKESEYKKDSYGAEFGKLTKPAQDLLDARNHLIELNTEAERQGLVVDDRLLQRIKRQKKLIAELEQETAGGEKAGTALANATAPEHIQGVDDRELGQIVKEFNAAQADMIEGDHPVTNIFAEPTKAEIVRLADKAKVYHKDHGWMTVEQAKEKIAEWKAHAAAQGEDPAIRSANSQKVVLSLFDLTGKWSQPWEEAGYQVYRFDIQDDPEVGDVNNFSTDFFGDWFGDFEGMDIHAVLAACPCTDFAVSGARHFAAKDADGRTVASVKLVHQTLRVVEYFKPAVWAIENPVGRIEKLGGLPPWRLSFDPNHLGDPYTKKTLLWGRFNADLPVAPVEPTEGSKMHRLYGGKSMATKNARSETPEGFSYGFFMANNAHDHAAMALANKFDRLDRGLIEQAMAAGVTADAIENAVEDFYYQDMDDDAANAAIRDLLPPPPKKKPKALAERDAKIAAKKQIPDMTDEELLSLKDFYAPDHARAPKIAKAIRERGLDANEPKPAPVDQAPAPTRAPALVKAKTGTELKRELDAGNVVELPDGMRVKLIEIGKHGWNYAYEYADGRGIWSEGSMPVVPGATVVRDKENALDRAVLKFDKAFTKTDKPQPAPTEAPVASIYGNGMPDPRNSAPLPELDGFKVGDRVSVKSRTLKDATIELLFTRSLPGFDTPDNMARLKRPDGGSPLDVQTFDLEKLDAAPAEPASAPFADVIDQVIDTLQPQAAQEDKPNPAESDQDRSHREWRENYDRVSNTDDLSTVSTTDLERANAFADRIRSTELRKGWDGGKVNQNLTDALKSEQDRLDAELKKRRAPAADEATSAIDRAKRRLRDAKNAGDTAKAEATEKEIRTLRQQAIAKMDDPQPAPAPTLKDETAKAQAQADLMAGLADLADIFGKNAKANITPEQEQRLIPVLTRIMDAAFRLQYYKFKDAARFVLNTIRDKIGPDVAAQVSLDHLQGSYIAMAGKYQGKGADAAKVVINEFDSLSQLEAANGEPNASPVQPESVSGGRDPSPEQDGTAGDRNSQPLDAGMAGTDPRSDRNEGVPAGAGKPDGAGSQQSGGRGQSDAPGTSRNPGNVRDGSSAADDFAITDDIGVGQGGLVKKYNDNIAAIRVIRALDAEGRQATADERKALAKYVGWGGLKGVFDPLNRQWDKQHAELKALLTEDEFAAARKSMRNAHYTSPTVVGAMFKALGRFGFTGGRVLEPSVGVGNFFGLMPKDTRAKSELHGVELDRLTSKIVANLYPKANIAQATGFQDFQIPSGYFDLVIGNPPFGREPIQDGQGTSYSGFSIHNYFFAKSIDKLRPGGILAMVVTNKLMDRIDPEIRTWMANRAELVAGVRLPNTAFKENANTNVVTDILFFRRTDDTQLATGKRADWLDTVTGEFTSKTGETVKLEVNKYFAEHPENVLGKEAATGTQYAANEYTVEPNGDLAEQLAAFVDRLPEGIYAPIERKASDLDAADHAIPDGVKVGSFFVGPDGKVRQRGADSLGHKRAVEWIIPTTTREGVKVEIKTAMPRMTGLIGLRDLMKQQMRLERSPEATDRQIENHRKTLAAAYDAFVKQFGYVNDQSNRRMFFDDTEFQLVQALEFDYDKGIGAAKAEEYGIEPTKASAKKADILQRRVLFPPMDVVNVQTAKDALLASLNAKGRVDMEYMREAYPGKSEQDILAELGDVVFTDPAGAVVMADEYLSGDVKTKLAEAEAGAAKNPQLQRNVEALRAVIPADKTPSEIFAPPGATWIDGAHYAEFARQLGYDGAAFHYVKATAQWLHSFTGRADYAKSQSEFGTSKIEAIQLLMLLMNGRAPEIKKPHPTERGRYVTDEEATEAARAKSDKIKSLWDQWLWTDDARAQDLSKRYNDRHNRLVERKYDGEHLTFPGMSPAITLLEHQKNAVWRAMQDRTILLDHVVGAGKTFEMTAMAMEFRRLGISRKPFFAVPNHLTLQWASEFARLYPASNVLAATPEDFSKENRKKLFAKIATGDWDAVIVGHSSLKKVGLPEEYEAKFMAEQIEELADAIEELKRGRGDRNIVRDMEQIKANLEAKLKKKQESIGTRDDLLTFAELGLDSMFVDEMHEFKNLFFTTQKQKVSGLGNPAGSAKAFDLFMKVMWLRDTMGDKAPTVTATGTPVSNSLSEMYTMQRYHQYRDMKRDGLHLFDAWAKQYGEDEFVYEVAPSGVGYRISQRFSKFKNLPALMGRYKSFADIITLDDLKAQETAKGKRFPVPKIKGGRPNNVVVDRSKLQTDYFGVPELAKAEDGQPLFELHLDKEPEIRQDKEGKWSSNVLSGLFETREELELEMVRRATTPRSTLDPNSLLGKFANLKQLMKESKGRINALSLTGLASKAGLDYRLIDPAAPDHPGSKINRAVSNIVTEYQAWNADKGTQIVFCDLSIPLSARAAMAKNEKRLYVRDDKGAVTSKRGTLHTIEGLENFPYYLVKPNKKPVALYDPVTGRLLKDGFENKAAANEFVRNLLASDKGQEQWMALRESQPAITDDELAEYKDANDIEDDADAEISAADLDGVSSASRFSVYDDMKDKLVKAGIPAAQIEFIHDHNTPTAKQALFKRVKAGQVRILFGSTPKLGAGTNVQDRLVALHHVDAPWRPSDLEQREGRIVRRGNLLYERDPDGFEVGLYRYATEQTYDTRRWQLLEHKAAGIEQLRKYDGANEIEDVTSEAANSADMKAAASGNPLILKETQLRTEKKRLETLERADKDERYALQSRIRSFRHYIAESGPRRIAEYEGLIKQREASTAKGEYLSILGNGEKPYADREKALAPFAAVLKDAMEKEKHTARVTFKGLRFTFERGLMNLAMTDPTDSVTYIGADNISPSGILTRMNNFAAGMEGEIERIRRTMEGYEREIAKFSERLTVPFQEADALERVKDQHGKVQRALMKASASDTIQPADRPVVEAAIAKNKERLRALGLGNAVEEMEAQDRKDDLLGNAAIDTPAFQAWFGDSNNVDAEGNPKVWYRGQIGAKADADPFASSVLGSPSFADTPDIASVYATNPDAARLHGLGQRPQDAAEGGNVGAYFVNGQVFDLGAYQGGHGTKTGLTPKAVRAILKELKVHPDDVPELESQYSAKYGSGKDAFWDVAESDVPDAKKLLAAYLLADHPAVQKALRQQGYSAMTFNGALSDSAKFDYAGPWDESKVHGELRVVEKGAIKSAIGNNGDFDPASDDVTGATNGVQSSTPEFDLALGKDIAAGATADDLLAKIETQSVNPDYRELAAKLRSLGLKTRMELGSAKDHTFAVKGNGYKYQAGFDPNQDRAVLFQLSRAEANILHELVHAATFKALRKNGLAAQQMKALYRHVKQLGTLNGTYGMENLDEFVAESFTNAQFQSVLRDLDQMPTGSRFKNAWDKFVAIVLQALGLPVNRATLLDQVLRAGQGVMEENQRITSVPKRTLDGQGAGKALGNAERRTPADYVDRYAKLAWQPQTDDMMAADLGNGWQATLYHGDGQAELSVMDPDGNEFGKAVRYADMPTAMAAAPGLLAQRVTAEGRRAGDADMLGSAGGPISPQRRKLLAAALAAMAAPGAMAAGTPDVALGKARAIDPAILREKVSPAVAKILIGNGATNPAGEEALAQAMDLIAKSGPTELRALAATIKKLLPKTGVYLTVDQKRRMNAHGAVEFQYGNMMMTLFTAGDHTGLSYATVLHEALHVVVGARYQSLSVGMIRNNDKILGLPTPGAAPELQQFRDLWSEFKDATRGEKFSDDKLSLAVSEARSDPDEFFVRSLTDPTFQKYLAGKQYQGKTLLQRFKDWVKSSLFGIKQTGTLPSWLDAALIGSEELLSGMTRDPGDLKRYRAIAAHLDSKRESAPEAKFSRSTRSQSTGDRIGDLLRGAGVSEAISNNIADRFQSERTFNSWWHKTVGTQYHKAQIDRHFKRVYDLTQRYLSTVSLLANEAADLAPSLLPKLEGIRDLAKKPAASADTKAVGQAVFAGTLTDKRVYSPAELKAQFKLTGEKKPDGTWTGQIGMYHEFRKAVDQSLDDLGKSHLVRYIGREYAHLAPQIMAAKDINEAADLIIADMEQSMGDDEVMNQVRHKANNIDQLKIEGYAPLSRFGEHTVYVKAGDGSQLYFGMTETAAEAAELARAMREAYPDATVTKGILSKEGHKLFSGISPDTIEAFANAVGVAEDPLFQDYLKLVVNNRSAMKRLIHRKGVPGFSQDTTRVLANFLTSNARAASRNLYGADMSQAAEDIPKEKGDVRDEAIRLVDYVQHPVEEAAAIRGLLFTNFIGGSLASAAVNMTQPLTMTLPYLAQFKGAGNAATVLAGAMKLAALGDAAIKDAGLRDALQNAEREGVVSPQEIHNLQAEAMRTSKGLTIAGKEIVPAFAARKMAVVWGGFFSLAEQFNRKATFIAAYQMAQGMTQAQLQKHGVVSPYAFAVKAIAETQGVYNRGNRPDWARGAIGATLMTFKQYSVAYLEFLTRLPPKERALALAILVVAAGVGGLPFAEDAEDIIDTIAQALGYNWQTKKVKEKFVLEILGEHAGGFVLHGFSGAGGLPLDVSLRMGMGNLLPATGLLKRGNTDKSDDVLEIAGAAGGFAKKLMTGADNLLKGDVGGAYMATAATAIQNVAKAVDMMEHDAYRDGRGRKVMATDGLDAVVKGIGFQPANVADEQRKLGMVRESIAVAKSVQSEIADQWAQGIYDKDPAATVEARRRLAEWNERNPDSRISLTTAQIARRVREMRTEKAERLLKTAPKAMRAGLREELE